MTRLIMRLARPRFRLRTLCFVVALLALVLASESERHRRVQRELRGLERGLVAYEAHYGEGRACSLYVLPPGPASSVGATTASGSADGAGSRASDPKGLDFRQGSE